MTHVETTDRRAARHDPKDRGTAVRDAVLGALVAGAGAVGATTLLFVGTHPPHDPHGGLLGMLDGTAGRPYILRASLVRAAGWLGNRIDPTTAEPTTETSSRSLSYACFGMAEPPMGAVVHLGAVLAVTFVAQFMTIRALRAVSGGDGLRAIGASMVAMSSALAFYTPGAMQTYDGYVWAWASAMGAALLTRRWSTWALLLMTSALVKESLALSFVVAIPLIRAAAPDRRRAAVGWAIAGAIGTGLLRAAVERASVAATGPRFEVHLLENLQWPIDPALNGPMGWLWPLPFAALATITLATARTVAEPSLRWAVVALVALHVIAVFIVGRVVETRVLLEVVPIVAILGLGAWLRPSEAPAPSATSG